MVAMLVSERTEGYFPILLRIVSLDFVHVGCRLLVPLRIRGKVLKEDCRSTVVVKLTVIAVGGEFEGAFETPQRGFRLA